jgi:RNA polymerase sigma factor (sigma-70 family)
MTDDFELLRDYVERGAEPAFRTLVERHARMVHGGALRLLGNATAAEEASQAVFILLARKASSIRRGTVLAGWLYRTTQFVARAALRSERRRTERHDQLAIMNDSPDTVWPKVSLLLEDAMADLNATDRNAVLLRFFEGRTFAEVARSLGTTEPAAKMRISRAVEKLRQFMAREGVAVSATTLPGMLAEQAASAVPIGLVQSISLAALANNAASSTSLITMLKGALKLMAWNKLRNTALAVILILLLGGAGVLVVLNTPRKSPTTLTVETFAPMAGEWEGDFEMRSEGAEIPVKQRTAMSVRSLNGGRACEIEMRILQPDGSVAATYQFHHSLNEAGNRISTMDGPNPARQLVDGTVTVSADNPRTGEWRAGFHAVGPNGSDTTECEWQRRGDELIIKRQDRTETANGPMERRYEMHLRRSSVTARL